MQAQLYATDDNPRLVLVLSVSRDVALCTCGKGGTEAVPPFDPTLQRYTKGRYDGLTAP
jgi:hypothetical protein